MKISVRRLEHAQDLPLPSYATSGSAGFDLLAAINAPVELPPNARAAIPCGIAMALPQGHEAQIRPRSGLALNHGITVLNAPGTVDSDYRGEVKVILINLSEETFRVTRGMKIAQMVIGRCEQAELSDTEDLPTSTRNAGGFGSTGLMRDT